MIRKIEAFKHYIESPLDFVKDVLGAVPTPQQEVILNAIPNAMKERKAISVKSGHGVGKTAMESWIILWFMATRPYPKIPCTAPTQHQLFDILWAELAKWHNKSRLKDYFEWTRTHFVNKLSPENWFAVARSCKKPENMQGFHSDHLLFIIEEASGVPPEIMEVVEGALTQEGALCVMFGNPTQVSGTFHDSFYEKRKFYYTFTLNSEEATKYKLPSGLPLVSPDYCKNMAKKYGRDSDIYRVRVLGKFPKSEPDTIISLDKVEKAVRNDLPPTERDNYIEIGVDVARFGDDESVICVRQGNKVLDLIILKKRDTMYLTGVVAQKIREWQGSFNVKVAIDETGIGGGVIDRIKELKRETQLRCEVTGINNGSRARRDDKFINMGSEMWFWISLNIEELDIPNDNDLIGQLTSRKYSISSKGLVRIERKEDMKKRGLTSPDRADALILAFKSRIYEDYASYTPTIC